MFFAFLLNNFPWDIFMIERLIEKLLLDLPLVVFRLFDLLMFLVENSSDSGSQTTSYLSCLRSGGNVDLHYIIVFDLK